MKEKASFKIAMCRLTVPLFWVAIRIHTNRCGSYAGAAFSRHFFPHFLVSVVERKKLFRATLSEFELCYMYRSFLRHFSNIFATFFDHFCDLFRSLRCTEIRRS